ncbi:MAG: hypothetical protein FD181_3274 [Prolixibacteraceae bacterium]|nr:MAG: hypothetical protein FD181_3274 [Prolixibacteraceae bacterium]
MGGGVKIVVIIQIFFHTFNPVINPCLRTPEQEKQNK